MSTPLDRRHPLWETWVVDGLPEGRWGLICKVHHCMVDGVAGVDLMAVVLSDSPTAAEDAAPEDDWSPRPPRSDTELFLDAIGGLAKPALGMGRRLVGAVTHPADTVRSLRMVASGLGTWLGGAKPTPPTAIHGPIGSDRRWTWARASLADAKAIRADRGGTVNDVVLAAVTGGFRNLLEARGEDPATHEVRTLVPVSVRVEHGVLDNEVSALVVDLPVGDAVPELRYEVVRTAMQKLKGSDEAEAGEALTALAEYVPAPVLAWGTKATAALLRSHPPRAVTTVTTNVPGPQFPLYGAGRRMLAYYPFVPIALGVRYGVAILSYDGELYFGLTGDREASPDLDVLAKGIEAAFTELLPPESG